MKSILQKIKDKIFWILGGIISVLGIILAIEYEKKKIQKLKTETIMVKTKNDLGLSDIPTGEVRGREEVLKHLDYLAMEKLKQSTQEIANAKKTTDRPVADIVNGLNKHYGRRNEGDG
jgi:hypothetical protein